MSHHSLLLILNLVSYLLWSQSLWSRVQRYLWRFVVAMQIKSWTTKTTVRSAKIVPTLSFRVVRHHCLEPLPKTVLEKLLLATAVFWSLYYHSKSFGAATTYSHLTFQFQPLIVAVAQNCSLPSFIATNRSYYSVKEDHEIF